MVSQVGGEEGVHPGGARVVEVAVARAAADRDGVDHAVRVTCRAYAPGGGGQRAGRVPGQLGQGHRLRQPADPADPTPLPGGRTGGARPERAQVGQSQPGGERVGDARIGHVGVGVRDVEGDVALDQPVDDPPLVRGRRHRRHPTQQQRMVGDDQIRPLLQRLGDGLRHAVDHAQHPTDRRRRLAEHQSDPIPLLGPGRRVAPIQRGHHIGHARRLGSSYAHGGPAYRRQAAGRAAGSASPAGFTGWIGRAGSSSGTGWTSRVDPLRGTGGISRVGR